jgi:hypothetical protein
MDRAAYDLPLIKPSCTTSMPGSFNPVSSLEIAAFTAELLMAGSGVRAEVAARQRAPDQA